MHNRIQAQTDAGLIYKFNADANVRSPFKWLQFVFTNCY